MRGLLPWYEQDGNNLRCKFGNEDYQASREAAGVCSHFSPDDEDEQIDDVQVSCFNCMNRRWLESSIECIQLKLNRT
ncbi:MAG: hypothetical protein V5788_05715 [Shewanella sp.]